MTVGLVLSGGGARGIAHLGIIKALQEQGVQIDRIAGTSAGAVAGALLATGYSPDEILEIVVTTPFFRHVRPAFNRMGLLKLDRVEALYRTYLPEDRFEALKIPLHVVATDINAGECVVFEEGELVRPLVASCCLPGIFAPYQIGDRQYVDGAVLNNMPVEMLENKVDFIIGASCNPPNPNKSITSVKGVLERSLMLAIRSKTRERLTKCDLLVEPPDLCRYEVFDLRKAREIFRVGYEYTRTMEIDLFKLTTPSAP
ncbi:patatin-like phospholipase family protein [Tellurirhabdus bombi]|uniref:patatin-like phospholipase family protein n=1 Tax=Tellurirhabdus bombi TaxID=2907205 RepID=UPI001F23A48C|nr:patatin-like phospholipase family protein [Tellurirhabdus bombi]